MTERKQVWGSRVTLSTIAIAAVVSMWLIRVNTTITPFGHISRLAVGAGILVLWVVFVVSAFIACIVAIGIICFATQYLFLSAFRKTPKRWAEFW